MVPDGSADSRQDVTQRALTQLVAQTPVAGVLQLPENDSAKISGALHKLGLTELQKEISSLLFPLTILFIGPFCLLFFFLFAVKKISFGYLCLHKRL